MTVHLGYHDPLIGEADQLARGFPKLERSAAHSLRQTVATESLIDTAFHLLRATEALAPKSPTKTDYVKVKKIMGEEAYRFFYERDPVLGTTRRDALAHGRMIDEGGDFAEKVESLHRTVLDHLRTDLGVTAQPAFTSLRGFTSFERITAFLERLEPQLPALPDLVALAFDGLSSASSPRLVESKVSKRLWKTY